MPAKYPHVVKAEAYARDVIDGKIPACRWTVLACKRHFSDKKRTNNKGYKYKFDRAAAEDVCEFAEKLPHIKDSFKTPAGSLIVLEPWQCFILALIFGWVHKTSNKRRFRRANVMIPRKNGKSTIAAVIALYMLVADGEAGAEIYSGATTEKQAYEVFTPAKLMVQKSPDFQAYWGAVAGQRSIAQLHTNSFFKTLIGKPGDGASPHCSIHDEYHEHPTDEQVDTMRTGMGARRRPLQLIITTAGDNLAGPCYMEFEDGKKILEETVVNDEVFVIIYTIDEDDEWDSEIALRKANPNYGVSVDADFLFAQQTVALQNPRKLAIFLTKHLNVWVGALNAYFDMPKWKTCRKEGLKLEDFHGKPCYPALDLASKVDLNAIELLFPLGDNRFATFTKYYLPEAALDAPGREHFRAWAEEGWITVTDGEIIDFETIEKDILRFSSLFQMEELAYDPWQATQLATNLQKNGAKVVEYRQTVQNMSEPMKTLDALIRAADIEHDGNPVTTWCMSNVVAKKDAKENVYPRKARDENKIDGAIAKIMALGRAILGPTAAPESIYKQRGIRTM